MAVGWWISQNIPVSEVYAMPTIVKFERTMDAGNALYTVFQVLPTGRWAHIVL